MSTRPGGEQPQHTVVGLLSDILDELRALNRKTERPAPVYRDGRVYLEEPAPEPRR